MLLLSQIVAPSFAPIVGRRLELNKDTVHWGYFSKLEQPKLTITSGETVTVEMASHHACDDYDKATPLLQACAHP